MTTSEKIMTFIENNPPVVIKGDLEYKEIAVMMNDIYAYHWKNGGARAFIEKERESLMK